jgi:hypothetical protein
MTTVVFRHPASVIRPMHQDYSHRAVTDKLGLKPGQAVRRVGQGDQDLLAQVRKKTGRRLIRQGLADVILFWPKTVEEIVPTLSELKHAIASNGGIWVITAKKNQTSASGMGYYNQDLLIPMGQAAGLVDNKICSLSERESAMRFVIRKQDRAT